MDPYLEQPAFWSEFHNRLIVAIADMLGPSLRPKYYIGVETRTYLDDANDELLVGIPDAAVVSSTTSTNPDLENTVLNPSIAVQDRPLRVMLPMPIEVKERYLEVRELGTDAAIAVDEELTVDLQAIITGVYDRAGYDLRVDYRQPPPSPPLSLSDSLWLENLLTPLRGE